MRRLLALVLVLAAAPAAAQQAQPLPQLSDLVPVLATDATRLVNEINLLTRLAQGFEGQAAYWQDACRSTPECGGKPTVTGELK